MRKSTWHASFTSGQVLSLACRRADQTKPSSALKSLIRLRCKIKLIESAFKVGQLFLTNSSSRCYSATCPLANCSLHLWKKGYSQWIYCERKNWTKFATRAHLTSFWSPSPWSKTLHLKYILLLIILFLNLVIICYT